MNIAYCTNENYYTSLLVSLFSVLKTKHEKTQISFFILYDGLTKAQIDYIGDIVNRFGCSCSFVDISEKIQLISKEHRLNPYNGSFIVWVKIFLPVLLPGIRRCLFIDTDTLIVKPLDDLYYTNLNGKPIGMVPDAAVYCDRNRNDRYFVDSINLYYNTGVIVCDFDKWISAGITESIVNGLSSSNSDFYYPEQTALSFFCQDFIFRLPLKFNLYTPLQKISYKTYTKIFPKKIIFTKTEFAEASSSFYILHFYGRSVYKPWFRNNSCVYSSLYKKVEKSLFGKNIPNIKWPVAMSKKERIKSIIVLITSKLLPRDTYMRILSHIK